MLTESAGLLRVDASYALNNAIENQLYPSHNYSALFLKHINDHVLLYPKKKTLRACYVRRIITQVYERTVLQIHETKLRKMLTT